MCDHQAARQGGVVADIKPPDYSHTDVYSTATHASRRQARVRCREQAWRDHILAAHARASVRHRTVLFSAGALASLILSVFVYLVVSLELVGSADAAARMSSRCNSAPTCVIQRLLRRLFRGVRVVAAQATSGEPGSGAVSKYLTSKTRSLNFQPYAVRR
ncbi:hypothetical protein [Kribbella pittospori]|uniref:hypothetical protein n=1 Tax=Kribbella pittospori TaxID=722689 RepID=UPI00192DE4F6|nr:hypothetical protein [Kribbella pittospori]